jgi:hypothetical protein
MTAPHEFRSSLDIGEKAEKVLDEFFSQWWTCTRPPGPDKDGIDRVFSKNGKEFTMQYKADFRAANTRKAFVETISVDAPMQMGWAFTGKSKYLCYWVPPMGEGVIVRMAVLRNLLGEWMMRHETKPSRNGRYTTYGICVPWWDFTDEPEWEFELPCPPVLLEEWQASQKRREES